MSDGVRLAIMWTLAERPAKARRMAGIDRQEMADYLGVTVQAIGHYEGDRRVTEARHPAAMALRTGVDLDWLRYGDQVPLPDVVGDLVDTADDLRSR